MTVYELIQELTAKYQPEDTVYICDDGENCKVESVGDYGGEPVLQDWPDD
jgi:hypothetical protein